MQLLPSCLTHCFQYRYTIATMPVSKDSNRRTQVWHKYGSKCVNGNLHSASHPQEVESPNAFAHLDVDDERETRRPLQ